MVALEPPGVHLAWTAVVRPVEGDFFLSLRRADKAPATMLWYSNGGRDYAPWSGGGSLLDYLGYGATLGTWFLNGEVPQEVTAVTWAAPGLEVDEHAICVLRYTRGHSRMAMRWGGAVPAPDLPYLLSRLSRPHRLALVGAGGLSFAPLDAYRSHGFDIAVILSLRTLGHQGAALRVVAQALAGPATGFSPMLASALLDFGDAQASLGFDAATPFGPQDETYIADPAGSLIATGPDLGRQRVELHTAAGVVRLVLRGQWFNDGFAGAMGALLVAIEMGVPPENAARAIWSAWPPPSPRWR